MIRSLCLMGLVCCFACGATADDAVVLESPDLSKHRVLISDTADGSFEIVDVEGQSFDRALRITVREPASNVWDVQLISAPVGVHLQAGDVLEGSYFHRAEPVGGSSPEYPGYFRSEADGFEQLVWLGGKPGDAWSETTFRVKLGAGYEAGDLAINLHFGNKAQVIELADLKVKLVEHGSDQAAAEAEPPPSSPAVAPVTNAIDEDIVAMLGADAKLIIAGNRPADFDGPGPSIDASLGLVDVEGQAFKQAARIHVGEATDPIWDAQLTSPATTGPIRSGDLLFGYVDIRGESNKESGGGQFMAWLQSPQGGADGGWTSLRKLEGAPGPAWLRRYFNVKATRDFPAGGVNLVFQVGVIPQTIDVANVMVWNLGPDADAASLPRTDLTYEGRALDAPWRAEAERRIDAHRKADLTIEVVDGQGRPVRDAKVHAHLDRNAFHFATFMNNSSPALRGTPDGEKFGEIVTTYFNAVTTPSYGAETWGWPDPDTRWRYLETMAWARSHNLRIKAHPIVWSRFDWSPAAWLALRDDPEALRAEIRRYIVEIATLLEENGAVEVDLHNEPVLFSQIEQVITDPGLGAEWFEVAHEAAPGLRLGINEHSVLSASGLNVAKQDAYAAKIQDLLDRGAPLQAIGFQGHMGEDFTPPTRVWKILDRFAAFGLPLTISEFDINTEDEDAQADYLRDFVTAVYAHEAVDNFTLWGFWAGDIWVPAAAMWTEDWQETPAAEAWIRLMTETFHTDETLSTDASGVATVRGHRGDYTVTVDGQSRAVTLGEDGATVRVVLD